MARPIWTGSLGFGLVSVAVGLYSATQDHGVHFHQLERGTSDRIRYRRVNERTGEEVPRDRIVRAVDLGDGEYVVVEDDELEAIEPERSRAIEITDFVDLRQIDPVFFETTYYLAPRGEAAGRAYALLRAAMERAARVGIAVFVLRGRERVVAVRPDRRVLALETMYFADEVRDPLTELPELPGDAEFTDRELSTAGLLVESLSTDWRPEGYRSSYRDSLADLIERKRHGETLRAPPESERVAPVVDLMDALNASLEASRRSGRPVGEPAAAVEGDGRGGRGEGQTPRRGGRRGGEPRRRAPGRPEARRRGASAPADGLRAMTKTALMERAAELGVPGRSKMGRDELEDAVRRASRRRAS